MEKDMVLKVLTSDDEEESNDLPFDKEKVLAHLLNKKGSEHEDETILPPFDEDEIVEIENHLGEKLPEDFRYYITNISREIYAETCCIEVRFKYHDRCSLCSATDLNIPCTSPIFGLPANKRGYYWGYCGNRVKKTCPTCNEVRTSLACFKCGPNIYGKRLDVGSAGCANTTSIILSGPHKGSIWWNNDDEINKIADSFVDYYDHYRYL